MALGLGWDHGKRVRTIALMMALVVAVALTLPAGPQVSAAQSPPVSVIVREVPGSGDAAEALVERLGGTVGDQLEIIGGFSAQVPAAMVATLTADPAVYSVTPDTKVRLLDFDNEFEEEKGDSFVRGVYDDGLYKDDDAKQLGVVEETPLSLVSATSLQPIGSDSVLRAAKTAPSGWMPLVNDAIGAMDFWDAGYTGAGVDVALIDSGIAPVQGVKLPGKVVNGLDISFESQADNLLHLDTYGHGTHMAGIIAGRDSLTNPLKAQAAGEFVGVAPGARIINIKVADSNGAVDVSQVIAAIDWVVQHRNDHGMNIRVLNLSFGTDGTQEYTLDPLAYAVQMAWDHGIVVVVAAGNDGNNSVLRNPALNPYVIAVGATDTRGTERVWDDFVTDFSNCGTSNRRVDLVAPGRSIESLRVPGSAADQEYPAARVEERFFKGSGTSQATAVVSGAVALIIDQRPGITPDQVKELLAESADEIKYSPKKCRGGGTLNLAEALDEDTDDDVQRFARPSGAGFLELSRGSAHLIDGKTVLEGEQDIFGTKFDSASWSTGAAQGASWSGGDWNGSSWSGASWSSKSWSGASWSSASWSSASWSGASWSSASWSSASWSGASWSSASWSGMSWSSASWSSNVWSSKSWGGPFTTMSKSWSISLR
jgi:serine protease AprX